MSKYKVIEQGANLLVFREKVQVATYDIVTEETEFEDGDFSKYGKMVEGAIKRHLADPEPEPAPPVVTDPVEVPDPEPPLANEVDGPDDPFPGAPKRSPVLGDRTPAFYLWAQNGGLSKEDFAARYPKSRGKIDLTL